MASMLLQLMQPLHCTKSHTLHSLLGVVVQRGFSSGTPSSRPAASSIFPKENWVECPTTTDPAIFKKACYSNKPVLYPQGASSWPAVAKWDWDYFSRVCGDLQVPIQKSISEQDGTKFDQMTMREFMQGFSAKSDSESSYAYLTEFELFDVAPALLDDVSHPFWDYTIRYSGAWIGKQGGKTGFHYDHYNNTLTQIKGTKQVYILAPTEDPNMYISDKYDMGATLSKVPVSGDIDLAAEFPNVLRAKYHLVTLNPGDILYIPRNWWHAALCQTDGISVNCQGIRLPGLIQGVQTQILHWLHGLGYYRSKDNCTCCFDGKVCQKSNLVYTSDVRTVKV